MGQEVIKSGGWEGRTEVGAQGVITTAMKGKKKEGREEGREESRKEPLESVIQNLLLQNLPKISHTYIYEKRI